MQIVICYSFAFCHLACRQVLVWAGFHPRMSLDTPLHLNCHFRYRRRIKRRGALVLVKHPQVVIRRSNELLNKRASGRPCGARQTLHRS